MSAEANKTIVRRFVDEVINGRRPAALEELVAATYTCHTPNLGTPLPAGPEQWRQRTALLRTAFPDGRMIIEDLLAAEDERVVVRYRAEGTHRGPFRGLPPTGTRITYTGIIIWRIRAGQVAEEWTEWDALGLMRQVGAVPTPGARKA